MRIRALDGAGELFHPRTPRVQNRRLSAPHAEAAATEDTHTQQQPAHSRFSFPPTRARVARRAWVRFEKRVRRRRQPLRAGDG